MATLENKFSWSNSRAGAFARCLRAYWWQYYGSWGGWDRGAPARAREAYMLKNLTSRWAWVGTAVHERIERILKRIQDEAGDDRLRFGAQLDVDAEVEAMTRGMRRQYAQSLSGAYRDRPKHRFGLMEHEYGDDVPDSEWLATSEKARAALRGFLTSGVFAGIRASDPSSWIAIEELDQFRLDDVGIWASPDFARGAESGGAEVYDWKTGAVRPEKNRLQMACYALYMEAKHGLEPQRLTTHLVYLGPDVEVHDFAFTPDDLAEVRRDIAASAAEMRARLADEEANRAEMDAFPMTEHRDRCAVCVYRRLCGR